MNVRTFLDKMRSVGARFVHSFRVGVVVCLKKFEKVFVWSYLHYNLETIRGCAIGKDSLYNCWRLSVQECQACFNSGSQPSRRGSAEHFRMEHHLPFFFMNGGEEGFEMKYTMLQNLSPFCPLCSLAPLSHAAGEEEITWDQNMHQETKNCLW